MKLNKKIQWFHIVINYLFKIIKYLRMNNNKKNLKFPKIQQLRYIKFKTKLWL
jgi:hypothetical protein